MHIFRFLVTASIIPLLFTGVSVAQDTFVPKIQPMPVRGPAGTTPSVLSMDAVSPFLDGISPKRAEETLRRIPATERRTRGAFDVELFRRLSPSVVLVKTNEGSGSGSVIAGGLILTNWHVVGDNKVVGVIFKPSPPGAQQAPANPENPTNLIAATVIRVDQVRDLALLRPFSFPTDTRKPIELADPKDIAVGADAHAIGHPHGHAWSYTKGIISQVHDGFTWGNDSEIKHHADIIQMQTPISEGSSGGPLLSDEGKLIGVNSFFKKKGQALNFAVSVKDVRSFVAATGSVIARKEPSKGTAEKDCKSKPVFEGRNKKNDANIMQMSLKCDDFPDLVFVLPDDVKKPMLALVDSKRRSKADGIVFDSSRSGNWKVSYWDVDFDDTFPLKGIHSDGEIKPVRYEKRCAGKAASDFRCM